MTLTARKAPVVLLCSERSGSNLISMMIGAHSNFFALPPFHFGRKILLNFHEIRAGGDNGEPWRIARNRIVRRLRTLVDDPAAKAARSALDGQPIPKPEALLEYLYLDTVPAAKEKRVFVKENKVYKLLHLVMTTFPDAKFVFQVRDPRDFLASSIAAGKNGSKFGNDRNALMHWGNDQEGALQALGILGEDRVFLHRYEDLLSDPADVLTRLCAFLDEPFEDTMLSFHETEAAKNLAATHTQRSNISKPLIADNFAKFRTTLKPEQIERTESQVGGLMTVFGYPNEILPQNTNRTPVLPQLIYP